MFATWIAVDVSVANKVAPTTQIQKSVDFPIFTNLTLSVQIFPGSFITSESRTLMELIEFSVYIILSNELYLAGLVFLSSPTRLDDCQIAPIDLVDHLF